MKSGVEPFCLAWFVAGLAFDADADCVATDDVVSCSPACDTLTAHVVDDRAPPCIAVDFVVDGFYNQVYKASRGAVF